MTPSSKARVLAVLLALCAPVNAAIEVRFVEDAPKDRFVITNVGACAIEDLDLVIDLGPSMGGLYFDTTASGAGVQVFQPFEVASGALSLVTTSGEPSAVDDGQNVIAIRIARLAAGARGEFTIDVDDSVIDGALGQSRVASAEIAGARVRIEGADQPPLEARFDVNGRARTPLLACPPD